MTRLSQQMLSVALVELRSQSMPVDPNRPQSSPIVPNRSLSCQISIVQPGMLWVKASLRGSRYKVSCTYLLSSPRRGELSVACTSTL